MENENKDKKNVWITEGFVILLLTLFAYVIITLFEQGFATYFGIPSIFISINIFSSIPILMSVVLIILSCLYLSGLIYSLQKGSKLKKIHLEIILFLFNLTCLFYSIRFLNIFSVNILSRSMLQAFILNDTSPIYIKAVKLICIVQFCFTLIFILNKILKKPKSKLNLINKINNSLFRRKLIFYFAICVTVSNLIILPFEMGLISAFSKKTFVTIDGKPELVVLNKYEDYFVCVQLDKKSNSFHPIFVTIKFKDNPTIKYNNKKIGKIRPLIEFSE